MKKLGILEFYHWVRKNGRCLQTIRWIGEGKDARRVYCLQPVTQVWRIYVPSMQGWYAASASCEKHCSPGEHNHPISEPYPYCGDWTTEKLRRINP